MIDKTIIGRAEHAWLVDWAIKKVPARIDTGARTTALWASNINEVGGTLQFTLFGDSSSLYTGNICTIKNFTKIVVANSTGHVQHRYKIPITLQMKGRRVRTFCTLSDRSTQAFPLLIGRNTLRGKYVVDVQKGSIILDQIDKVKFNQLQALLDTKGDKV